MLIDVARVVAGGKCFVGNHEDSFPTAPHLLQQQSERREWVLDMLKGGIGDQDIGPFVRQVTRRCD